MEINDLNYEGYALDYAEGNLAGETLAAMELYLQQYPELKEEILAICATILPETEPVVFQDKSLLIKQSSPVRFLKVAVAISSAACLLLAVGFVWLLSKQDNYGELAHQGVALNIHTNVTVVTSPDVLDNINTTTDIQIQIAENQFNKNERVLNQNLKVDVITPENQLANRVEDLIINKDEIDLQEEQLATNDLIVDNLDLQKEENSKTKIAVNIEKEDLIEEVNEDIFEEAIIEDEADVAINSYPVEYITSGDKKDKANKTDKSARRRAIKGGLWGVFQSSFVPEGIASN